MSTEKNDISRTAREYSQCFACGCENTIGLHLHFTTDPQGAEGNFILRKEFEGYPGIIHGGIVSTVLDEIMAYAIHGCGLEALTAKLTISYRKPLMSGVEYLARGRICERRGRLIRATAEILDAEGTSCAEAEASWLEKRLTGSNS